VREKKSLDEEETQSAFCLNMYEETNFTIRFCFQTFFEAPNWPRSYFLVGKQRILREKQEQGICSVVD
jgi:hypothetical protein